MHNKQINFILKFGTLLSIFSFVIIIWILLAKVDIVAQAVGQISPDGKIKTINVLNTSLVKKIYVKEGQYVEKGTVVAQLDIANYTSDEKSLAQQLSLDELSLKRIEAELIGKTLISKNAHHSEEIYEQVQSELLSKQASHKAILAQSQAQILETKSDIISLESQMEQMKSGVPMWEYQILAYEALKEKGSVGVMSAQEKIFQSKEKIKEIEIQKSKIASLKARLDQNQKGKEKIQAEYRQQLFSEKTQLIAKIAQERSALSKNQHQLVINSLKAPTSGWVKEITVSNEDVVLSEGSTLMTIVPKNEILQAHVIVKNQDIGELTIGKKVKIKVSSFPFQKYGLIEGTLSYIGADATALNTNEPKDQQTQNSGYRLKIDLSKDYVGENKNHKILPGMAVQADIIVSQRTIFEYLTSPLKKTLDEALTEK